MSKKDILEAISAAVIDALKIKLAPGEICPCCGRKQSKRNVTEQMREANRANIQKAHEAKAAKRKK